MRNPQEEPDNASTDGPVRQAPELQALASGREAFHVKPSKCAKLLVTRPLLVALLWTVAAVACGVVSFETFELQPVEGVEDLFLPDEPYQRREFAHEKAEEYLQSVSTKVTMFPQSDAFSNEAINLWTTCYFKSTNGENLVQDKYIRAMAEVNERTFAGDDFDNLCWKPAGPVYTPACVRLMAWSDPLALYTQDFGFSDESLTIPSTVGMQVMVNYSYSVLANFGPDFMSTFESDVYKVFVPYGLTYPDLGTTSSYQNLWDRYDEQRQYWRDNSQASLHAANAMTIDGVEHLCAGQDYYYTEFANLMELGGTAILSAYLLVFAILLLHARSPYLAVAMVVQPLIAFPIAYFIYRFIFGIEYLDFFETILPVLAVGTTSDITLVVYDTWRQSVDYVPHPDRVEERMAFTVRHGGWAAFVETAMSTCAFLATTMFPMVPLQCFGVFGALTTLTVYCVVMTWLPAQVFLWRKFVRAPEHRLMRALTCRRHKSNRVRGASSFSRATRDSERSFEKSIYMPNEDDEEGPEMVGQMVVLHKVRAFERFLRDTYASFIIKARWLLFAVFIGVAVTGCVLASGIKPLDGTEQFFVDDHWVTKFTEWDELFYGGSILPDPSARFVWGIEPALDTSEDYDAWTTTKLGVVAWDSSFDLSPPEAQLHVWSVCQNLTAAHSDKISSITCPIDDLKTYAATQNESFPLVFDASDASQQRLQFDAFVWTWLQADDTHKDSPAMGYDHTSGTLRSTSIMIRMSNLASSQDKRDMMELWDDEIAKFNTQAASAGATTVGSGWQFSSQWSQQAMQDTLASNAISGVGITMGVAGVLLLLATQNVYIVVIAMVCIGAIATWVLALVPMCDWSLGVFVSITIVVMIDFCVDITITMSVAFNDDPFSRNRHERLRFSLFTTGYSLVSSTVVTLGAAVFLTTQDVLFYQRFGMFIIYTDLVSIGFAFVFLTAMFAIAGPSGHAGNLMHKWRKWRGIDTTPEAHFERASLSAKYVRGESRSGVRVSSVRPASQMTEDTPASATEEIHA